MNDKELTSIFDEAYKFEYSQNFQQLNAIHEQARDKLFATQLALGIVAVVYAFSSTSALDKNIIANFDFSYKLGGSIPDIIRNIPQLITQAKIEDNLRRKTHKNKLKANWEYLWGIIPYKLKGFTIKGAIRAGSVFSSLNELEQIAEKLGRQRAIIDLREELITRFINLGGDAGLFPDRVNNNFGYIKLSTVESIREALHVNDLDSFFKILQGAFASLPYNINTPEGYVHSHIHFILNLINIQVESEVATNRGRIDTVIQTDKYIYIIEYKLETPDIALKQVLTKDYPQRYSNDRRIIILVGVSFDKKTKNISGWKFQQYDDNFLI